MLKSWGPWLRERADKPAFVGAVTAAILLALYFWNLGSNGSLRADELAGINAATTHNLLHQSVNLPYNVFIVALKHLGWDSTAWTRGVSAAFGLAFVYCFYLILKCWFGRFTAWLGTLFFAATPLIILAARESSGLIACLYLIVPIAAYMKWIRSRTRLYEKWLVFLALATLAAYQPGGLWFLLISAVYVRQSLLGYAKQLGRKRLTISALVVVVCLIPLVLSAATDLAIFKTLLLIPAGWPSPLNFVKNMGWSVMSMFWHSRARHELQIGRLAILNAAQDILLVFGAFAMWDRARAKLYALLATVVFAAVLASINQNYNLLILGLPALGVILTAGIRYLHLEWTTVFPRNPLPRGLAVVLLVSIVAIHMIWGAHYALNAWPHSLASR
ncbi:MAG TPA: hypothetical protein VG964_00105 [Candidatus Saccharimonadales bacterium]|nr:hypothetical protein [Candidatus Saccharimonadales bacterium]